MIVIISDFSLPLPLTGGISWKQSNCPSGTWWGVAISESGQYLTSGGMWGGYLYFSSNGF